MKLIIIDKNVSFKDPLKETELWVVLPSGITPPLANYFLEVIRKSISFFIFNCILRISLEQN